MVIEINVPDIGTDEVEVTEILVGVGDKIEFEQPLIILEGEKVSMEVPSPQAGVVRELAVEVGDKVTTGKLIMLFEICQSHIEKINTIQPLVTGIIGLKGVAPSNITQRDVNVPDIGDDELEVTEMLIKPGDEVKVKQPLIVIRGCKISMEVSAPFAGIVNKLIVNVGDKVRTGSLVMVFEVLGDPKGPSEVQSGVHISPPKSASNQFESSQNANFKDVNSKEIEIKKIIGNASNQEDQLLTTLKNNAEHPKADLPFLQKGRSAKISRSDKAEGRSPLALFGEKYTAAPPAQDKGKCNISENKENGYTHATPLIRRLIREFCINPTKIKGTGRKGRILREDVDSYIKIAIKLAEIDPEVSNNKPPFFLPQPIVNFSKFGSTEVMELGRIQKISGMNLHRNWITIPHVTQFDEADITDLEAFRKDQNIQAERKRLNLKITLLVFIIKAIAKVLQEFPRFNSSLSEDAQKLTLKKYINIGVAVNTSNGLVVPVFRDVNKKNIVELAHELTETSKKARAGKLASSDMQGGCFTISSLGGVGGMTFTPIINAPEVAVLGVSTSLMKPIWDGKEFKPRLMLPMALSYDHRVIDGVEGARCIGFINKVLSDIRLLVL